MSTVEILVIPPFFAAERILASALKNRIPKRKLNRKILKMLQSLLPVAKLTRMQ